MLFPDAWWGTHYLAFLPSPLGMGLLFSAGLIVVLSAKKAPKWQIPVVWQDMNRSKGSLIIIGLGLLMATLFYNFPIADDNYGDAFQYSAFLQRTATELPPNFHDELFTLKLMPSTGRKSVLLIYTYISHVANVPYEQVFRWAGALCGFGFVVAWLLFVRAFLKRVGWQLLLGIAGITAPFMQLYYGHIETYAPVFLIFLTWLILLLLQLKKGSALLLWMLLPLLLISGKVHPLTLLLGVPWILALLKHYGGTTPLIQRLFTWKGITIAVLLPIFALGTYAYFFVFGDHIDARDLDNVAAIERLFLPIFSPEAPLDRYNLFSLNHFFDFFQMMLLWCPPMLFLILALRLAYRKMIDWAAPNVLILSATLILFAVLLFAINPLLSMPMDWDLFSFPAPILLVLTVVLVAQIETQNILPKIAPSIVGLMLMSIPVFVVNASQTMRSYRAESVGVYQFKTYYLRSNVNIISAISMIPEDLDLYLERKQVLLDKLRPFAIPGNDPMYGSLLYDDAAIHLNMSKNYVAALDRLLETVQYNAEVEEVLGSLRFATLKVMEIRFMERDFAAAYVQAEALVALEHPTKEQALRIAVHCALEAKLYAEALAHAHRFLALHPSNAMIQEVVRRLEANDSIDEVRLMFSSGN
jgi:hypothetical protein